MGSINVENERRSQFWFQGTTDFDKGKAPRWSTSHAYYVPYMQGYEFARRRKREQVKQERRERSWWTRLKQKVTQWLRNW